MPFIGPGGFSSLMNPFGELAHKFVDWYQSPITGHNDYMLHQAAKGIPFIGNVLQAGDNERRMQDYLNNRGLSWSDVRYNAAPFGPTLGQAAVQVTDPIMRLYKNTYKDMQKGRENARKEKWKQYVQRQMLEHRQVQTAWYRNHMRRY